MGLLEIVLSHILVHASGMQTRRSQVHFPSSYSILICPFVEICIAKKISELFHLFFEMNAWQRGFVFGFLVKRCRAK